MLPLAFGLAKRVEPELGAMNLGRLLVFANTMASFVLFVELFSLYIIIRDPIYLYVSCVETVACLLWLTNSNTLVRCAVLFHSIRNTSFSGFAGGITALLVAFMKPTPLATAPIFPGLKLRVSGLLLPLHKL